MTDFPIIDIALLDDPTAQLKIAQQITTASQTWGFLLLKNHPIPSAHIKEMFHLSRSFFASTPEGEKSPWPIITSPTSSSSSSTPRPYIGYNAPRTDRLRDDKASMWLSGKPGTLSQHAENLLPPFWRPHIDTIETFKHECFLLVEKLLVCFALAMGLSDRQYFARAHAETAGQGNQFRLLWYPAREEGEPPATTRMSPHSDSGSVTLLFQTCAGLEVEAPSSSERKGSGGGGGEWVPAPCLPDHILVNLGDALAMWSGGRLRATKHRVTFAGVPHDGERLSMAYFCSAAPETVLEPIATGMVDDDSARLETYEANGVVIRPGITMGEYGKLIMENIYGGQKAAASEVQVEG